MAQTIVGLDIGANAIKMTRLYALGEVEHDEYKYAINHAWEASYFGDSWAAARAASIDSAWGTAWNVARAISIEAEGEIKDPVAINFPEGGGVDCYDNAELPSATPAFEKMLEIVRIYQDAKEY